MQLEQFNKLSTTLINDITKQFTNFIQTTKEGDVKKYLRLADNIIKNSKHTMLISFKDFMHYNNELAMMIFN